ncbi:MAG: glutamate--tRNA ligase family protein, partial [Pseudomonadota bacterium]
MVSQVRTRFAPSPTGYMHVGNLRTALFNALYAYQQGGLFYLRIEDTDIARSTETFAESIKEDLAFMGLSYSGVPVVQSERNDIYADYYTKLIDQDLAYPCYCTEVELAVARKTQLSAGIAPRYSGACKHLTKAAVAQKEAAGIKPSLRLRVPENQPILFDDAVFGPKQFST